jgi:tetratricopeptide (TPR) repeat protein
MDDDRRKAEAYLREASLHAYANRLEDAQAAGERALALLATLDDADGETQALRELAFLHWSARDYGSALDYSRRVLDRHRRSGDGASEATALHNLAEIYRSLDSPRLALGLYEQALDLLWGQRDVVGQGMTLYGMSHALGQMNQVDTAAERARRALDQFMTAGDLLMASRAHHKLAGLCWQIGDLPQAIVHIEHALRISREIGYGPGMAHGLVAAGYLYTLHGNREKTRIALDNAKIWFSLIDDVDAVQEVDRLAEQIEKGKAEIPAPSSIGWVRSHVLLSGGTVFCEFETPMVRRSTQ